LIIPNRWTNYDTGEEEYFGLKDRCEDYFAIDSSSGERGFGFKMIQADGKDGFSKGFANDAVRYVGAKSDINPQIRKKRLMNEDVPADAIVDFGTDGERNRIPDIIAHDLRASFCTQLARNETETKYAMTKTGHKLEETYNRYVSFARDELDKSKDKNMF
jgi:hypothetical protein